MDRVTPAHNPYCAHGFAPGRVPWGAQSGVVLDDVVTQRGTARLGQDYAARALGTLRAGARMLGRALARHAASGHADPRGRACAVGVTSLTRRGGTSPVAATRWASLVVCSTTTYPGDDHALRSRSRCLAHARADRSRPRPRARCPVVCTRGCSDSGGLGPSAASARRQRARDPVRAVRRARASSALGSSGPRTELRAPRYPWLALAARRIEPRAPLGPPAGVP